MSDTIKSGKTLIIEVGFMDGDTRTITLRDPRDNLTENDIKQLETMIMEDNLLIGDREESSFKKIKIAKVRNETRVNLDLG